MYVRVYLLLLVNHRKKSSNVICISFSYYTRSCLESTANSQLAIQCKIIMPTIVLYYRHFHSLELNLWIHGRHCLHSTLYLSWSKTTGESFFLGTFIKSILYMRMGIIFKLFHVVELHTFMVHVVHCTGFCQMIICGLVLIVYNFLFCFLHLSLFAVLSLSYI